jgi:LPS-assembly lipoprotein
MKHLTPSAHHGHRLSHWLSIVMLTIGLGACGFTLQRVQPLAFDTLLLVGVSLDSPLGQHIRSQLQTQHRAQVQVADASTASPTAPNKHAWTLEILGVDENTTVAASTANALVRDLTLQLRVRYRLSDDRGQVMIPEREVTLSRDMSFQEPAATAKRKEARDLFDHMQTDIVKQLVQQIGVVSRPQAPLPVGPAPTQP